MGFHMLSRLRLQHVLGTGAQGGLHWLPLFALWALVSLAAPGRGFALGWRVSEPSGLSASKLEELQRGFPDVSKAEDLSALLRAISQQQPMAKVEAYLDDEGQVSLLFSAAASIARIEVSSLTRKLRQEIEAKLGKYLGQTDSQELRQQVLNEVAALLRDEAYFLAKATLDKRVEDNNLVYHLRIDEDYPCTIARSEYSFRLPPGLKDPFEKGMFCAIDEIKARANQLEAALIDEGYNQQRIQTPEIVFDPKSNSAVLRVRGSLGKKVRSRISSPIKTPALIAIVFGDDLNTLDPSITDPDAMASELIRQYKAQGYDDVEVGQPRALNPDPDTIEYQFEVKPGPEYRITEVQFEGLAAIPEGDALEAMDLYPGFGNSPLFSQDLMRQSRDALAAYYKQKGFWDARVFDPRVIKNPLNGEVKVVFVVREGKRRIFQQLIVSGNTFLTTSQISALFPIVQDEALAWQQLIDFEKAVRNLYRKSGFLNVQMNIEIMQNRQFRDIESKVVLTIVEGQRSRFGEIYIKGLVKTLPEVVQRELRFRTGEWFDPDKIEESRQALIDLGLFSSVSISSAEALSERSEVISYTVLLREARSGTVSFGPGWSLGEGLRFSVESSYNNIAGTGRKIFSKGLLNQERDQTPLGNKTLLGRYAGIGYLEPYLLGYPVDGTLSFNHKATAQEKSWEISRSAEATASHRIRGFLPRTNLEVFTLYKETREEAEGTVKEATLMESGNLQIREVGIRHVSDGRNNLAWPTKGYRVATELSYAGFVLGGGLRYTRWGLSYNAYKELFENVVIAAGFSLTSYMNIERRDNPNILPSTERLPAGGAETNRGFRENSLGPVFVTGEKEQIFDGGSQRSIERLELRYQLISETLAMTTFLDSSNSFFTKHEEQLIRSEFDTLAREGQEPPSFADNEPYPFELLVSHPSYLWTKNYLSYGLAFNYLTPLGSVNLSFGWPWRRCLNNLSSCDYPRGNSNYRQLRGAVIGLNIGANF